MAVSDEELLDLLTLQLTPGIGPIRVTALLEHFGSASAVLRAGESSLGQVDGIGVRIAQAIRESGPRDAARRELARAREIGTRVLVRGRDEYPPALVNIPGAPLLLFVRGELRDERCAALVGTRHPTAYGRRVAVQLATGLARAGVTVVSGMARGIDGIAHQAALEAGGRTLAVLAGGFDRLYPPEHRGLAERIEQAGALITESVPSQEPLKGLFPARNRIISGLSRAVVIIQAGDGSGALITAEHAADQGRPVLAVPGAIDDKQHAGCHQLIRDGATLCRGVEDVLEEMDGLLPMAQPTVTAAPAPAEPPNLNGEEGRLYALLEGRARSGDELAQEMGMAVPQLAGLLLMLEMRKVVRRLPGNRYERV